MKEYKIVIVGSRGVGKSNLRALFVQECSLDDYNPGLQDYWRKLVEVEGEQGILLDILVFKNNTMGQFPNMKEMYMKLGQGFVLVYSITDRSTFNELQNLRKEILSVKEADNVPMILVGNKMDLEGERVVGKDEGLSLARSFGCSFMETSIKRGRNNVDDIFYDLAEQMSKLDDAKKVEDGPPKIKGACSLL